MIAIVAIFLILILKHSMAIKNIFIILVQLNITVNLLHDLVYFKTINGDKNTFFYNWIFFFIIINQNLQCFNNKQIKLI